MRKETKILNLSVLMRMWWHPSEITQAGPKASCVIGRSLQNISNIIYSVWIENRIVKIDA